MTRGLQHARGARCASGRGCGCRGEGHHEQLRRPFRRSDLAPAALLACRDQIRGLPIREQSLRLKRGGGRLPMGFARPALPRPEPARLPLARLAVRRRRAARSARSSVATVRVGRASGCTPVSTVVKRPRLPPHGCALSSRIVTGSSPAGRIVRRVPAAVTRASPAATDTVAPASTSLAVVSPRRLSVAGPSTSTEAMPCSTLVTTVPMSTGGS